ncbi:MAG: hypothetical protein M0033_13230 [Nitrospiraceae bacterium]|nr:hypothetical protein [Nitrospiraceae bacterium]
MKFFFTILYKRQASSQVKSIGGVLLKNILKRNFEVNRGIINLKTRLYLIAAIVLLAGLSGAVLIYLTAGDYSDNVGYEVVGGNVYPVNPEDSKIYIHDLELYGGKANVVTEEFMRWFDGLWHGKTFAFTVAVIVILISLGFILAAKRLSSSLESGISSGLESDIRGENDRTGTG